ncbi:M36 family metallopeptidase [Micromonospora sp. NBC_01699]|uniref:M36 family metallopeptidase n=1 Tax=Micromonospora sp. NBC_01699 TaxID=2975984 RepID=UPI002E326545|nr:M36 family metallopeptidase [Micromonospora sp. NBC_01699]
MRLPERTVFGNRWRVMPAFATAVVIAATLPGATAASAAPDRAAPATPAAAKDSSVDEHNHEARDKDNRRGTASPSSSQRSVAGRVDTSVRWNAFGTPHALGPVDAGLATGLATDPETAARQYLVAQRDLFGLDEAAVAGMEKLLVRPIGTGAVVTLRQRFGDLPAGVDGLVSVAVDRGTVVHVSSSLTRDTSAPAPLTISADEAYAAALADADLTADQVASHDLRKVAVPTPVDGNRAAWEVTLIGKASTEPAAFTTFVDGTDRSVLVREDLVDYDSENPQWAVFPANPPSRTNPRHDDRVTWCFTSTRGCEKTVQDAASGQAWDVDLATGEPTLTTRGNSANNVVSWGAGTPVVPATPSPTREYDYPFTDQWRQSKCNPEVFTSLQRNDIDAATANLFAMHNRMHDWAYNLGFDEGAWNLQAVNLTAEGLGNDAEQGRAQQGALTGNRNNANQSTPRDGLPPSTNMYLWQPIAGTSYPPCVDGDYDMTVIGHEYAHAITNRMIGGPDAGIGGHQGGSMGESWGDLLGTEYLVQNGWKPAGKSPYIVGGYVTGNLESGIRNYDLSRSPLNYSDVGYALSGPAVHADGEIWGATNHRIRSALVDRYGDGKPSIQVACAEGKLAVDKCPGNRRWTQLVFDSYLLQAVSQVSMLDMRDNMLAADVLRFGGRNQDIIWNAFAESGMGRDAATVNAADTDPTPSFASPHARNATVTLRPKGDSASAPVRLYVGEYEARAVPIADTDPATALPDTFEIVPGKEFSFLAVAPGFGHTRFTEKFKSGEREKLDPDLERNLASLTAGAVVSGDGVNLDRIADDTEATNWASLDGVAGKRVTVDLPGDRAQTVRRVNVSAYLRPAIAGDVDTGSQNALSALRSFTVLACDDRRSDCTDDASYRKVYTSRSDAFPGGAFRPYTRELNIRSFEIPKTTATHLRLEVTDSQCTGGPLYAGEQDNDPATATDCTANSPFRTQVRIAEFQAFER